MRHVPVCVMREFSVLVEAVRRPVGGVADLVVAISSGNARNVRRRHFAASVVAERVRVAGCRPIERIVCVHQTSNAHAIGDTRNACHERATIAVMQETACEHHAIGERQRIPRIEAVWGVSVLNQGNCVGD